MVEELKLRVYGEANLPTLIFLPGIHGDWTLIGSFRRALGNRVRFVEITYPRTLTWSLEDYAAGVEDALFKIGITSGWLLGESFSSQVVWPLVARNKFQTEGVIIAGGFVKHPMTWAIRCADRISGGTLLSLMIGIMFVGASAVYAKVARWRFRHSPETLANINEFIARRTPLDREAAKHRLRLIGKNDPRTIAKNLRLPLFAISGSMDPIVPWINIRWWLSRHSPALREYKIIWPADHNVLSTAADEAADQIVKWISERRVPRVPDFNLETHGTRPSD
jgi:pimeloyl-ACP methyl ester carboxylesterase